MNTLTMPLQGLQGIQTPAAVSIPAKLKTPSRLQEVTKKLQDKLPGTVFGAMKFTWNKIQHGVGTHNISSTPTLLNNVAGLNYFTGIDENGICRGGNLPWLYINDIYASKTLNEVEKYRTLRNTLAYLPGNVSFRFIMAPDMQKLDTVKSAFTDLGFMHIVQKTFIYTR